MGMKNVSDTAYKLILFPLKNIYQAVQAYINQQSEVNRVHCRNLKKQNIF